VKAAPRVFAAADAEGLRIDEQRPGPAPRELRGADRLGENVDPVDDDLAVAEGIAATSAGPARGAGRQPVRASAGRLGGGSVAGSGGDRGERFADLAGGEAVFARARLTLPRLEPGRALDAVAVRLTLAGQHRREAVAPITVRRSAEPALATVRRLAVPAGSHHDRAGVLGEGALGDLHRRRP